jgi:phage terminase large subunit-like protein
MIPWLSAWTADDWAKAKAKMPPKDFTDLVQIYTHECWLDERRKLYAYYPDEGPLRRELYPKHMEFFAAGKIHSERAAIAANRVGKSFMVAYEATCHMTGWYPKWWEGRRFNRPITAWFSGEDGKAVRESLQKTLLGPPDALGTGMVPNELLVGKPTAKSGVPEAFDAFAVKHAAGGSSRGLFKAYDQGRESFQAAQVDVVVFDEEPPMPIYTEGMTRTLSTVPGRPNGIVMCAFTPILGMSAVVLLYLPGGKMVAS